jgi:hypothetical protein
MVKIEALVNIKFKDRMEQAMNKHMMKALFISCLALIFAVASAFAQEKVKGPNKNISPGWDKGEKKGWQSDVPPGQEEKDEKLKGKTNKPEKKGKRSKSNIEQEVGKNETEAQGEQVKQGTPEAKSKTMKEKPKDLSEKKKSE